jgi:branched-chain amino acid transport system substrate-binding protein
MSIHIGVLLPRSTEYPAMGFDLLDGLRLNLKRLGIDAKLHTENIGFGEDTELNHSRAEKLVLEEDVQLIIAYATSLNAEALYGFAASTNKPILFLDAGMEIFEAPPSPFCYHLTLQGLAACLHLGREAGKGGRKIISATSFLDAGYRSSWMFFKGLTESGGSICGNYVSMFKNEEFTLDPLFQLVENNKPEAVVAAFSSYFDGLFFEGLAQNGATARTLPFYCSPFMADEQLLPAITFPGGTFHTAVTWSASLANEENKIFLETILKEKNKRANFFHLLGWEAAIATQRILSDGINALGGWSFESPRGVVHFDTETHNAFSPIYTGNIEAGDEGKCKFTLSGETILLTEEQHRQLHSEKIEGGQYSRWRNNFFCI